MKSESAYFSLSNVCHTVKNTVPCHLKSLYLLNKISSYSSPVEVLGAQLNHDLLILGVRALLDHRLHLLGQQAQLGLVLQRRLRLVVDQMAQLEVAAEQALVLVFRLGGGYQVVRSGAGKVDDERVLGAGGAAVGRTAVGFGQGW